MRRSLLFITFTLFFCVTVHGVTFTTSSQQHLLAVNVADVFATELDCRVRITDLATNQQVETTTLLRTSGDPVHATLSMAGKQISLTMRRVARGIMATVEVHEGAALVDSFQTAWQVGRPRAGFAGLPGANDPRRIDAPDAYRVGGDVKAPVVISRVEPVYPEQARKDRIGGIVIVEVLIDKTGLVKDAVILKDLPDGLGNAAVDAVKKWTFKPGTRNGEPVDVIFNLTTNFRLDNQINPEDSRVPAPGH